MNNQNQPQVAGVSNPAAGTQTPSSSVNITTSTGQPQATVVLQGPITPGTQSAAPGSDLPVRSDPNNNNNNYP